MDRTPQHAGRPPAAFLAYVTWDRVVPWKILSLPQHRGERFAPLGYGAGRRSKTRNPRNLLKQVQPGDTIYVVTMPWTNARGIPPTLVARLHVKAVCCGMGSPQRLTHNLKKLCRTWNAVAIADPCSSEFYGLNDATAALHRLGILMPGAARGADRLRVIRAQLGQRVQKILRLNTSAGQAERAFAGSVAQDTRQSVFISYAHIDGEPYALELARHLMQRGLSPWLDALAIPRYNTKKEGPGKSRRLQKLLRLGIEQSALGLSVITDSYLKKKDKRGIVWTRREWDQMARRRQRDPTYRCVRVMRAKRWMHRGDASFEKKPARQAAAEVAQWWRKQLKVGGSIRPAWSSLSTKVNRPLVSP